MAAISLMSLAGLTVTYNDVQFGGSEAANKSTPPTYAIRAQFLYDDSNRAVKATRYLLQVQCIFYETSEVLMHANMEDVRRRLSAPGKVLHIEGLGIGFGADVQAQDVDWGPKPVDLQMVPLGQLAWSCSWTVEFTRKECQSQSRHPLAFLAFNFDTSYRNDFEGVCERTIQGYVEIAISRQTNNTGKIPLHIADEVRDNINILIPDGFRRTSNSWHPNAAGNRLDFVVTDEMLAGDVYPDGISAADGISTFDSEGPGFAEAAVGIAMDLRVAPDKPRASAMLTFLVACITKQNAMMAANPKGTVIPASLHMSYGKFDRARDFSGRMSWLMTKCLNDMMKASAIWEPITPGNYNSWRASVQHLWGNRGLTFQGQALKNEASEAAVIDICDNVTSKTIGNTPAGLSAFTNTYNFSFTCPTLPPDGGWMGHDLRVRILRRDNQTTHRKAVLYNPTPGQVVSSGQDPNRIPIGGTPFTVGQGQEHDVEFHGLPETYIILQFKGLRFIHKPAMPELKSVAGLPVTLVEQQIDGPRHAFDILVCPAWFIRGYRIYKVNGYVPDVRVIESQVSCNPIFGGDNQEV